MKRIVAAGLAGLVYSVLMPLVALAQVSDNPAPQGPTVSGSGGSLGGGAGAGAGTAFTGVEIAGLVLFAVVLVGAGVTALVLARRRTSARAQA